MRPIPNSPLYDGMGLYPLFVCRDWTQLHRDLKELSSTLVSVRLVTDSFGDYDTEYLRRCFPDVTVLFEEHFVADLADPPRSYISTHHLQRVRMGLKKISATLCQNPLELLREWVDLYSMLIRRHHIRGIAKFSIDSFAKQLAVPGAVAFRVSYHPSTPASESGIPMEMFPTTTSRRSMALAIVYVPRMCSTGPP